MDFSFNCDDNERLRDMWREEYEFLLDCEQRLSGTGRTDELDDSFYADLRAAKNNLDYYDELVNTRVDDPEEEYEMICRSLGLSRYC